MDFIAIDLDKYDVWDAFRQPVPIREQSYVKTANWGPGEEIDCESDNPNDGCFENDRRPKQKGVGQASPSFGNYDPSSGYQDPGTENGDGFGSGGLSEEQKKCVIGQIRDRKRNEAAAKARDKIKDKIQKDGRSGEDQPEYAVSGFYNDDHSVSSTEVVTGQSYSESNPPETPIPFLEGPEYQVSDFSFILHSHGHTNDTNIAIDNQAPSNGDWIIMDALIKAGVDKNRFMMYIIDQNGTMRAYSYQTPEQRNATLNNERGDMDASDAVSNNTIRECK